MGLDELFGQAAAEGREPAVWEATVARNVGSTTVGVYVQIPAFDGPDGMHIYGPLPWMPRAGAGELPSKGDRALVAFTDTGDAWMIASWPHDDD